MPSFEILGMLFSVSKTEAHDTFHPLEKNNSGCLASQFVRISIKKRYLFANCPRDFDKFSITSF
jgi:hypothetical protein